MHYKTRGHRLFCALTICAVALSLTTIPGSAAGAALLSVVQVRATSCSGASSAHVLTGFVIGAGRSIVTAAHGVAGCSTIQIKPDDSAAVPTHPISILKAKDLVLLEPDDLLYKLPTLDVLLSLDQVQSGETLRAIGYPFGVPAQLETTLEARSSTIRQLWELLPDTPRNLLATRKSPSTTENVLSLQGHLTPGYSGAPILNQRGNVVGIANGGLENGTSEITWAVDALGAMSLLGGTPEPVSATLKSLGGPVNDQLFSYVEGDHEADSFRCFGDSFYFLRSVGVRDLENNVDDVGTFRTILGTYNIEGTTTRFNVFVNADGSVRLVAPEKWNFHQDGYDCAATSPIRSTTIHYQIFPIDEANFMRSVNDAAISTQNELCDDGYHLEEAFSNPAPRINLIDGVMAQRRYYKRTDFRCGNLAFPLDRIGTHFWEDLPRPSNDFRAEAVGSTCGRWICPQGTVLLPNALVNPLMTDMQRDIVIHFNSGEAFTSLVATRHTLLSVYVRIDLSPDAELFYNRCQRTMDDSTQCLSSYKQYFEFAEASLAATASGLKSGVITQ